MPPDETDLDNGDSTAPPADPVGDAIAALTPDAVRNSPEFKALSAENRRLARQAGSATREADRARTAAESARQAAEAQSQADLEGEISSILGEDGVAAYNEFADLSQTDPRAAARRFAEILTARAQSAAVPPADPGQPAPTPQGGTVTTLPTPRGVDASAPLGAGAAPPDPMAALVGELEGKYATVVERNNNPATRNRVTMKERAEGLISYLAAAYIRGGARPKV